LMRRIMVDHARQRHALKRGGAVQKVTLDEAALVTETRAAELLALDEALENLAVFDPRMSKIVEMRYFGGLTNEEIAQVLKIHPNTVMRDLSAAKAWLYAALSGEERLWNLGAGLESLRSIMPPSPVHRKSASRLSVKNATATRPCADKLKRWSSLTSDRVILLRRRPSPSPPNF